jgi:hypothetical protein
MNDDLQDSASSEEDTRKRKAVKKKSKKVGDPSSRQKKPAERTTFFRPTTIESTENSRRLYAYDSSDDENDDNVAAARGPQLGKDCCHSSISTTFTSSQGSSKTQANNGLGKQRSVSNKKGNNVNRGMKLSLAPVSRSMPRF